MEVCTLATVGAVSAIRVRSFPGIAAASNFSGLRLSEVQKLTLGAGESPSTTVHPTCGGRRLSLLCKLGATWYKVVEFEFHLSFAGENV
mmetsp:Transcript_95242/g.226827  ORF Transcript_95242/g.226827 Transcript_95242/m.226827 type:complete len:89 (+) Transcript_95242:2562-2828(+)